MSCIKSAFMPIGFFYFAILSRSVRENCCNSLSVKSGKQCEYIRKVISGLPCPSSLQTSVIGTLRANNREAHVWRNTCKFLLISVLVVLQEHNQLVGCSLPHTLHLPALRLTMLPHEHCQLVGRLLPQCLQCPAACLHTVFQKRATL